MNDDIRIWEVGDPSKAATPVESTNRMETEALLEELLAGNPDMLMTGLTLVGRQMPTDDGGFLDLLGADHVAEHSGKNEVDKIDDFAAWYGDRQGKPLTDARPTRMVLVGLGADARAHRMVEFLTQRGVDISLLTFHGYRYGDRMLLARQIEKGAGPPDIGPGSMQSDAERRRTLDERARELDMDDLWQDAVKALSIASSGSPTKSGITFYLPKITLPDNVNVSGSHSVVIDPSGAIRVTFYPGAIDVCWEKFHDQQATIPFKCETPPNAPQTKRAREQWYCLLLCKTLGYGDEKDRQTAECGPGRLNHVAAESSRRCRLPRKGPSNQGLRAPTPNASYMTDGVCGSPRSWAFDKKTTWEKHKEALTVLASDVHEAWREIRRRGADA